MYFTNMQDMYFQIPVGLIWMVPFEVCSVTYIDFHDGSATFVARFGIIFSYTYDNFACLKLCKNDVFRRAFLELAFFTQNCVAKGILHCCIWLYVCLLHGCVIFNPANTLNLFLYSLLWRLSYYLLCNCVCCCYKYPCICPLVHMGKKCSSGLE